MLNSKLLIHAQVSINLTSTILILKESQHHCSPEKVVRVGKSNLIVNSVSHHNFLDHGMFSIL